MRPLAVALALAAAPPVAAQQEWYFINCNKTLHYFGPGAINQIEFLSSDGRAFLWYDDIDVIVEGTWFFEPVGQGTPHLCFRYEQNEARTVPAWALTEFCWTLSDAEAFIVETREGDIFALSTGSAPAVDLPRYTKADLDELLAAMPPGHAAPSDTFGCDLPLSRSTTPKAIGSHVPS